MTATEWIILAQETIKSVIKHLGEDTLYENNRKLEMVIKYLEEIEFLIEEV